MYRTWCGNVQSRRNGRSAKNLVGRNRDDVYKQTRARETQVRVSCVDAFTGAWLHFTNHNHVKRRDYCDWPSHYLLRGGPTERERTLGIYIYKLYVPGNTQIIASRNTPVSSRQNNTEKTS